MQETLQHFGEQRALLPFLKRETARIRQIEFEDFVHGLREFVRAELDIDLVVSLERQAVDICRSNG